MAKQGCHPKGSPTQKPWQQHAPHGNALHASKCMALLLLLSIMQYAMTMMRKQAGAPHAARLGLRPAVRKSGTTVCSMCVPCRWEDSRCRCWPHR